MSRPVIGLTSRTLSLRAADQERPVETVARAYVEALEAEGALVVLLPNSPDRAGDYTALVDGLLLTGGDDPHPHRFGEEPHRSIDKVDERRDRFEIALVKAARERELPVFGICRGVQLMNIALGGDIYQDIADQTDSEICHSQSTTHDGPWHTIEVRPGSRLAALIGDGPVSVNSFHHQACRKPGEGLAVAATSAGDGLVEAIEDPQGPFFLGVQWHPEISLGEPDSPARRLFQAFVAAARDAGRAASKRSVALSGR